MSKTEFIENIHYYLDDGKVIMTEKYLMERGKCCNNNCRHCPYSKDDKKTNVKDLEN